MGTKTKKKTQPKNPLPPEELERRRAQRAAVVNSVGQLLYSRQQTRRALGHVSLATVLRLEAAGKLTKHRLTDNGTVFHAAAEVIALAGGNLESAPEAA